MSKYLAEPANICSSIKRNVKCIFINFKNAGLFDSNTFRSQNVTKDSPIGYIRRRTNSVLNHILTVRSLLLVIQQTSAEQDCTIEYILTFHKFLSLS